MIEIILQGCLVIPDCKLRFYGRVFKVLRKQMNYQKAEHSANHNCIGTLQISTSTAKGLHTRI